MFRVINNFIESYSQLREYADTANFETIKNNVDDVEYPYVCADIPENIKNEVLAVIAEDMGREPRDVTIFMRMSPAGVHVPHVAHTDKSMGRFSLMLYLNDHEKGGTSILRHKESGAAYHPDDEDFVKYLNQDINDPYAWAPLYKTSMKQNQAAIFDSSFFHRAEPVGGFGDTQKNARIVLTVFFS